MYNNKYEPTIDEKIAKSFYKNGMRELEDIKLGLSDLQIFRKEYLISDELDFLMYATKKFLPFIVELEQPEGGTLILMTRFQHQLDKLINLYNDFFTHYYDERKEQTRIEIDKYQGELYKYPASAIKYFCYDNENSRVVVSCGSKTFVTHIDNLHESVLFIKREWVELLKNNNIELKLD